MKVLVTGATAGIGKAIALALGRAGHSVIVHGRSAAKCAPVVDAVEREGGTAEFELAELTSLTQVKEMATSVRTSAASARIANQSWRTCCSPKSSRGAHRARRW